MYLKKNKLTMMATIAVCALAFITSGNVTVLAQTKEENAVIAVLRQNATAFAKNDMVTMNNIWVTNESLTIFESGHANYGWKDYRENHLGPELKEFKNTKYAFSDLKVKVDGKTAWATFKYTISAEMKERKIEGSGLGTAILEKRGGKWVIVHWHSSSPPRRPSPTLTPVPKP